MAEVSDGRVKASLVAKFALPLALVALVPALFGLRAAGENTDDLRRLSEENRALLLELRRATQYMCRSTGALDGLVTDAAEGIRLNFATGSYTRLLRLGILTVADLEEARARAAKYEAAHRMLVQDAPCQAVRQK